MISRASDASAGLELDDVAYPERLRALEKPPARVWVRGAMPAAERRAVAIVGTREPTAYGQRIAGELAAAMARAGVVVVSGLARGIDAAAHRAALEAGGTTVGVVAGGVDVAYPRGHARLQDLVAESGGLLSEWPNGTTPRPFAFPRRNAFIAALADATIVVEAGLQSGAHGTALHAEQLGRNVGAIPGPIDSPQSAGTNRLLRDGAQVIASLDDALALVGVSRPREADVAPADLSPEARACWDALGRRAADLEGLVLATGLPWREAAAAASELEVRGAVVADADGRLRRRL